MNHQLFKRSTLHDRKNLVSRQGPGGGLGPGGGAGGGGNAGPGADGPGAPGNPFSVNLSRTVDSGTGATTPVRPTSTPPTPTPSPTTTPTTTAAVQPTTTTALDEDTASTDEVDTSTTSATTAVTTNSVTSARTTTTAVAAPTNNAPVVVQPTSTFRTLPRPSGTPTGSATLLPSTTESASSSVNTGALVGGIGGGMLAVAAIAFTIAFFIRRWRRKSAEAEFDASDFRRSAVMLDDPVTDPSRGRNPRPPTMIERHMAHAPAVASYQYADQGQGQYPAHNQAGQFGGQYAGDQGYGGGMGGYGQQPQYNYGNPDQQYQQNMYNQQPQQPYGQHPDDGMPPHAMGGSPADPYGANPFATPATAVGAAGATGYDNYNAGSPTDAQPAGQAVYLNRQPSQSAVIVTPTRDDTDLNTQYVEMNRDAAPLVVANPGDAEHSGAPAGSAPVQLRSTPTTNQQRPMSTHTTVYDEDDAYGGM